MAVMNDQNLLQYQPIAWTPTPDVIERAQLTKFMRQIGVSTWDELYAFSINDVEKFTGEVLKFLDIKFDPPYEKLLDTSNGPEFPTWFGRSADTPVRTDAASVSGNDLAGGTGDGDRSGDTPVRTDAASVSGHLTGGTGDGNKSVPAPRRGWYRHGSLPHFDGEVNQFVTFRLGDSLPKAVLEKIKLELVHGKLESNSDEYRQIVEDYLDKGTGECILKDRRIAIIVREVIFHEAANSIDLKAWVIMPNHVHLLFRLREGFELAGLMKRIKGVSARKINQLLGQNGSVWQADYFDRYIRDGRHFGNTFRYIEQNPVVSKLAKTPETWEFGSAFYRSADTPVRTDAASTFEKNLTGGTGDGDKSVPAPSAGLNITEMCLDRWVEQGQSCPHPLNDQPAVIWEGEEGRSVTLSYSNLLKQVNLCSRGLTALGFAKGDAIGIHLPMILDTIIALLAINRIGAIALPVFSGYGVEAIASRLNAVEASGLFTCDGFNRRGKFFNALNVAVEAVSHCSAVRLVFVSNKTIDYLPDRVASDKFMEFDDLISWGENPKDDPLEKTSAEDPLIILYTSGTTGKPKGIVHTHASFPIKAAQDMAFGTDVGKGTRISWYTDIGWMMGPWLIYGALINGATICIYDGAPDYPTPDRMWEFCAKHKVEVLGISPTLIRSLARSGDTPVPTNVASAFGNDLTGGTGDGDKSVPAPIRAPFERHDLSALRIFASTGEPWNPAPWWWLFEKVGNSKLPIINYSGGTEISGGILMGNPLLPIKPCSFPAPCPGMDVDILDEDGNSVEPGEVGELVIRQPWIGMARGFWQEKERYLDTYWRRFKDIWVHGDFAMRDRDGHWFILGRSDDTLKIAGKRVGPAEVESLLVGHPLVTEAAVIGVPDDAKGTAMVAFCVLRSADTPVRIAGSSGEMSEHRSGVRADRSVRAPLEVELKQLVAKDMGKPLAPSRIHFVSALPKTRNGKVMRRVIRSAYLGEDPGDLSALENPNVVEEIKNIDF